MLVLPRLRNKILRVVVDRSLCYLASGTQTHLLSLSDAERRLSNVLSSFLSMLCYFLFLPLLFTSYTSTLTYNNQSNLPCLQNDDCFDR